MNSKEKEQVFKKIQITNKSMDEVFNEIIYAFYQIKLEDIGTEIYNIKDLFIKKNIKDFKELVALLRDISLLFEKNNEIKLAYGVMDIAYILKPNAPFIYKKFHEYKQDIRYIYGTPKYNPNIEDEISITERLDFYLGNALNYNIKYFNNIMSSSDYNFKEHIHPSIKLFSKDMVEDRKYKLISYNRDMYRFLSHYDYSNKLVVSFSDATLRNLNIPIFIKAKYINELNSGIILKLNSSRHFKLYSDPFTWDEKKDMPVWRGTTTGLQSKQNDRFRLVKKYSSKYNIGFSKIVQKEKLWKEILNENSDFKSNISILDQFKYKYIICIEGNDVATSLKWILASNSVPIMKMPTKETWLMESKLIPYKHFIPLQDYMDNLDEILHWCRENDDKCKEIALNGKIYINMFLNIDNENYLEKQILQEYIKKYDPEAYMQDKGMTDNLKSKDVKRVN